MPENIAPPGDGYTHCADPAAEVVIGEHQKLVADAVIATVPAESFVALVLIGGYARGEGGVWYGPDNSPGPYNDYDYFVVVRGTDGAERARLAAALRATAHELEHAVGVEVDFALLRQDKLGSAEYSLMNAEMLWGHRVVAGDNAVLNVMPAMPFAGLPLGEFTRLMLNRGSLLLLNQVALLRDGLSEAQAREQFVKYLFKSVLACGDARLATEGRYHPSYPEKRTQLTSAGADVEFLNLYDLALEAKFLPNYDQHIQADLASWQTSVVDLWLATFKSLESRRLSRALRSWAEYVSPMVPKGQATSRALSGARNIAVNWRDFGLDEFWRNPRWLRRHPRERLISTLPLLLSEPQAQRLGVGATDALRLDADASWLEGSEQFLDMWKRYS
ncbi:MAG: hypothetical protein K0U93_01580 [Gammaproteobacteria bacterium]|nr:hypothetical protein [Gammaproteobacteria bacterium]